MIVNQTIVDGYRDGTVARVLGGLLLSPPLEFMATIGSTGAKHLIERLIGTGLEGIFEASELGLEDEVYQNLIELAPLSSPILLGLVGGKGDPMGLLDLLGQAYNGLDFELPQLYGKRNDHAGLVLVWFGLSLELLAAAPGGPIEQFARSISIEVLSRTCGGLERWGSRLVQESPSTSIYARVGEEIQVLLNILREVISSPMKSALV